MTLVSSAALTATFGFVVGGLITNGLMSVKTEDALRQVDSGSNWAKQELAGVTDARDPYLADNVPQIVVDLARPAQGGGVDVAVVPDPKVSLPAYSSPNSQAYSYVPKQLAEKVSSKGFYTQRARIDMQDGSGKRLYLVLGRSLSYNWGYLDLYYFFPLDEQVQAAALVRNILGVTGLSLVLLLAMVAALVTRIVVNPVRMAARTAQRLSAGLLDQRMIVRGEDDLAALAASFNHMAENLQRHIRRLEDMSRLQRRFTSDVSHELRTPLTTVRMAADLIFSERDGFDPVVARSAELLQAELDRFEELLTDLLEISRFDAGFAVLDAEPVDLVPIVERVVERLTVVAEQVGTRIEVTVPPDPVIAEVDARRVERVLRNLVGNAVEHGEGKPVRVELGIAGGVVAITVRDFGIGLKPGEEKLVFNRFWRSDPSRARRTGGTGLGLSISVEDARLHGGWLEAWGSPGQGAQFRLTLPAQAGDRLVSSPLRLVPADAVIPQGGDELLPARSQPPGQSDPTPRAGAPAPAPTPPPQASGEEVHTDG